MEQIPVTFEHEGKQYTGTLSKVSGAGNTYHLSVNNFYQGQLVKTGDRWQFSTQKGYNPELADHFSKVITAFEDSKK